MWTRSRTICRPTSARAFTLVELLVVIGIITILASLLIPAISSIRGTSRQTQCASRLGQIGKAVINATTDGARLSLRKEESDRDTDGTKITENRLQTGILRSLEDHMDNNYTVYKCPAATGDDIGDETTIHFGFNGRISRLHSSDSGKIVALDYGKEIVDFTKPEEWETYKRPRHSDASNVLFFDGHVEQVHFIPTGTVSETGDSIEPKDYERVEKYWVPTIDRKYVHQAGDGVVYNAKLDIAEPPPQYAGSTYNYGKNFTGDRKDYGPAPPEPDEYVMIIDDGDSGFSAGGDYDYLATPGIVGYQTDWHRVQSGNTGEASWTFTGLSNSSQYTVSATWTSKSNRANDAVYTIGWGDFGGDAGGPSLPDPVIIDDGDSGFSTDFDYLANPGLTGYETDWHRKKAGEGAGEASWTFSSLQSGTYNVYATWREKENRANDAPYTLEYDGSTEQTSVDQIAQPSNDHTEGGRKFQNLWTVEVTGGTLTVKLNESANGSGQVIADAIRVECTALTDDGSGGGGEETGAVLATKTVNQRSEPGADFTADGRPFEELATVSPGSGEIIVKLPESAGSTGQVVADAVRIECLDCTSGEETTEPPPYTQDPDAPEETVPIVPGDPGYAASVGTTSVGRGAFVDLNYLSEGPTNTPTSVYSGSGTTRIADDPTAELVSNTAGVATYDSWSGLNTEAGIVGFDNGGDGIIDTAEDLRLHPPFKVPLRGIQIEIRVYEPESKSVRTVKVQKSLSQ